MLSGLRVKMVSEIDFRRIGMATPLGVWTLLLILYQTLICVTVGWFTLQCRLVPQSGELREVTLTKLLYLYDPGACGRIHFYNFTVVANDGLHGSSNIVWPVENTIASAFRRKMLIWTFVHVVWLLMGVVNVTQNQRSCGFYMTVVPFTLCGLIVLVVDVVFASMFLKDLDATRTEVEILKYINTDPEHLLWIHKMDLNKIPPDGDTSWISLMFAYGSCRGVVQWIVNLWIVKDNYFEGLMLYYRLKVDNPTLTKLKS